MSKNLFRMPKGYREMSVDELAEAILKVPKNRRMIEQAFNENPRGGERSAEFESVENQFKEELRTRKIFKEGRGAKADNLTIVKSFQNSEYMKTRGQRGGENIVGAYQRHYEAEWAAAHGYSYNPVTGRTKDEKGHFVANRGWSDIKEQYGVNTETMEYKQETKQYRFRGKDGKYYYMNTSAAAHYENEGFKILSQFANTVSYERDKQRNPVKLGKIGKRTK